MPNNAFSILSFFYNLFLLVIFLSKERIKSIETKIYKYLITSSTLTIFSVLICWFTILYREKIPLINDCFSKLALVGYLFWVLTFTLYVYLISSNNEEENFRKKFNIVKKLLICLFGILTIGIIILPLYYYGENNVAYSFGPSANVVYVTTAICMFLWIVMCLKNYKNLKNKKYLPVLIFIILVLVATAIQKSNPAILLTTAVVTFVTTLMYFTIENPDMKMIEQLNIAKDQAEKANNAKTEFLSSMSHEIRTPLNAIVGFSESLKEENLSPEAIDEVNDIIEASTTLLETVNGILDISKIEANKIEIVNSTYEFKKVFNELVALSKARLGTERPIEFRYHMAEDIPAVLYGDYTRIKQIVLNLLTNAIKYTKEGYINFDVKAITKYSVCRLVITVEDTGIGIKKESINRLFDRFDRLNQENSTIEGTGLGLAITKKLVDLMNGRILVQSVYGKGSQFMVIIDQKVVDKLSPKIVREDPENTTINHSLNSKKVLIVDDNHLNIKVATRMLKEYNVQVESAESGFECLDLINSGKKYDLILMDDMMPKMKGTETFHKLQEIDGFVTPVVVLTANAISGMKEKYYDEGFDDYLAKPIEKAELKKMVKKFLDK